MKREILLAAILLSVGQPIAKAEMIRFTQGGFILQATPGNAFGLAASDKVSFSGRFDDSYFSGAGFGIVPFGLGTGNSLTLNLGLITLHQWNEPDYDGGVFPKVHFLGPQPHQPYEAALPDMFTNIGVNGAPVDFGGTSEFIAVDSEGRSITGAWFGPVASTSTPEPGTLTLAAIGLVSFAGMAWRKKMAA